MKAFGDVKHIAYAGIDALILYFDGATLDEANHACIRWLTAIENGNKQFPSQWSWLIECVPSYDSLLIVFNYELIDSHGVYKALEGLQIESVHLSLDKGAQATIANEGSSDTKLIPVWYGAPNASDLSVVSKQTGLSIDDIIEQHTSVIYRVYAVGFAPGFAYMGEIPTKLQCPRLGTPRKRVPKGAVAIADRQTAVYPSESPGGWNLLGLTPLDMVTHDVHGSTSRLTSGDKVRFVAISEEEFKAYNEG